MADNIFAAFDEEHSNKLQSKLTDAYELIEAFEAITTFNNALKADVKLIRFDNGETISLNKRAQRILINMFNEYEKQYTKKLEDLNN